MDENSILTTKRIRELILAMVHRANSSHVGAAFSIVEILYTLYYKVLKIDPQDPENPERDKFILSKAHASTALYATLASKGFFPEEYLEGYCANGGKLPGHLDRDSAPGIEFSAGSLGHGLPAGLGMAIANKRDGNPGQVYVLLGDGECNEGTVWEAAMLASSLELDNLTVIIDFNQIQSFGRTNEVIDQSNLTERWQAFGWEALELDGHDVSQLETCFAINSKKPKAIIANTVKGKGVSFMEDKLEWHYKSPNDEQLKQALEELDKKANDMLTLARVKTK